MQPQLPLVIAVVGPTCSGKTSLAIELAKALDGEIVASDSRTIYKYMNIGTAKPTAAEQAQVPHHMIDIIEPDQVYTASQFKREAGEILSQLTEAGKIPVVCGGTGFYIRALLEGLKMPEVEPQKEIRDELAKVAEEHGVEHLREILRQLDPLSAEKIGVNDRFRLIRAIEVSRVLEMPFSQAASREPVPYNIVWIGLTATRRELLKERIIERIDSQLQDGLVAEVQSIYTKFGATQALTNTVAYAEFIQHIDGSLSLEQAREETIKHSVALARRQLIWFRSNMQMNWFAIDELDSKTIFEQCITKIKSL
ncbi:tRNA (adenosine(37)-N6)-dimethylallyltransferase MiaA [bacterium]|nr:tRNA (adenosine(37)-N6)-dimethylallyltransferase MiaA [bacterium]MBP9809438.1 tRNA (adenosine(37)-N6)-dimethylallyltransferase MiaA [bacterium]